MIVYREIEIARGFDLKSILQRRTSGRWVTLTLTPDSADFHLFVHESKRVGPSRFRNLCGMTVIVSHYGVKSA